jgi:TP901 family phage tail tape measure protein
MIRTSTESFTNSLEKNKFSMREYFRYAGGATKTFGKLFKSEFDTIGKVAEDRVKQLQTQYIKMGRDATGAMKAISVTPTSLNMKDFGTQAALAAQKQALFNQLVKQGSTNLLNFGKNTQWAGRQLMVGFTVPLTMLGTTAARVFMELETQAIRFKRVYGDIFTTAEETDKVIKDIELLAKSFTKYGVAVTDTMKMAADAAAMGKTGADLTAQVAEATRLAVLGGVEQSQALETTISLTNAFGIASEDLASKINFLNSVENQTTTSIEDLTIAVPKAGPVIKQLGGDVEDLAFFLTAMKEGGINASEGANALKSGLASMINPAKKTSEFLLSLGINMKNIVESNAGDVKGTVIALSRALDTLDPLNRSRAIEQLFGKFQFSRLSTLFQNVTKEGSQASRVLDLTAASVEELAILSERELKKVEDAVGTNFKASIEQLKLSIAPIGKTFLEAVTPIAKFLANLLDKFNELGDGTKRFLVIATTVAGVVGPALLMTFGLLANGAANIVKLFLLMRQGFLKLSGNSKILAEQTTYMTQEQLEAATVASSLNQAHSQLTQQFQLERSALVALRQAYIDATLAAGQFMINNPGMMAPGRGGKPPKKYAKGVQYVPGTGDQDSVAAMLTPGEAVIPKDIAQNPAVRPLLEALISGDIKKYKVGTPFAGEDYTHIGASSSRSIADIIKFANLSPSDQAKLEVYSSILEANGGQGNVSVRHNAAFSFPSELNRMMAKGGVDFEVFKEAWLKHNSEKWRVSGLDPQEAQLLDEQMLKIIENKSKANNGIVTDSLVEKSFLELPSSVTAGPGYGKLKKRYDTLGEYTLGKGLSDKPEIMADKIRKTVASKGLRDLPVVYVDGNSLLPDGTTVLDSIKSRKYRPSSDQHTIVTSLDSKGNVRNAGIYVTDNSGNVLALGRGSSGQRNVIGQSQSQKARNVAVSKGETIIDEKGKATKVTGQTGRPRKPSERTRRPSTRDGRVARLKMSASVLPNAEDGMVGVDPKTGKPMSNIATGIKSGGSFWANLGKKQSQVQEELIEAQEDLTKETENSTKNIKTSGEKLKAFGSKASLAVGAVSGLSIAASFAGGKIGEIAQAAMPFVFGLQGITALLPMLANPWVAAVAAIAVVGASMFLLAKDVENARKEGVSLAKSMSMTSDKLQSLSMITGKVSATEEANRRRSNITSGSTESQRQVGQNILESDYGKSLIKDIEVLTKSGLDTKEISKNLANSMSQAVLQGVITTDQARSIASALGEKLGSYEIPALISGNLVQLLGPNGENLYTDPLQVALTIKQETMFDVQDAFEQAMIGANQNAVYASVPLWKKALETLAFPIDNRLFFTEGAIKAENAKLDAYAVQTGAEAIAQNQKLIDGLNKEYSIKINNAKTEKEVIAIQDEKKKKIDALNAANAKTFEQIKKLSSELSDEDFTKAINASIDSLYKNSSDAAKAFIDQAKNSLNEIEDTPFKKTIQLGFASGELSASAILKILEYTAADKTLQGKINFLIKQQGLADTDVLMQLFAKTGASAKTIGIMLNYVNKNKVDFDSDIAAVTFLSNMQSAYGVKLNLEVNGLSQLTTVTTALGAIKDLPEKIDKTIVQKLAGENPAVFAGVLSNWTQLSEGKDLINKNLVINYLIGSADPALKAAADAAGLSVAEYVAKGFIAPPPPVVPKKVSDSSGKQRDTTLDGILSSLQRTRKASINATGGINELMKAFGKGKNIQAFKGLDQQLTKISGNSEFIDFLGGLDKKQLAVFLKTEKLKKGIVELTDKGQALKAAYDAKVLGDFSTQTVLATKEAIAQRQSFVKLTASGVSAKDAIDMLGDAQFAMAIKTAKNPKVIKELIAQFKELQKQQKITESALKTDTDKLRDRMTPIQEQVDMQTELLDIEERRLRLKYDPQIKALQDQVDTNEDLIETSQRLLEINYDRPIQVLQEEANKYNNELTGIDKTSDAINEKYDKQEEALQKIQKINSDIADQQKQQLDLAGALSSGDMSAAAQAIQSIRAANASRAAERSMTGLSAARKFELDALKGPSGLTRLQIQDKLYKIDQDIYKLEQAKIPTLTEITRLQDKNYSLTVSQEGSIKKLQDALDVELGKLETQRLKWVAIQVEIDANNAKITAIETPLLSYETILGRIKTLWEDIALLSGAEIKPKTPGSPDGGSGGDTGGGSGGDTGGSGANKNTGSGSSGATGFSSSSTTNPYLPYNPTSGNMPSGKSATSTAGTMVGAFNPISLIGNAVSSVAGSVGSKVSSAASAVATQAKKLGSAVVTKTVSAAKSVGSLIKNVVTNPVSTVKSVANTVSSGAKSILGKVFGGFGFARGGLVPNVSGMGSKGFPVRGTDTVPAMLTPGEFVMNRASTQKYGSALKAMNNGSFQGLVQKSLQSSLSQTAKKPLPPKLSVSQNMSKPPINLPPLSSGLGKRNMTPPKLPNFSSSNYGSSKQVPHVSKPSTKTVNNTTNPVYNYSLSINANGSNANANDIARTVMTQIKSIEDQRVRRQM